jgi:hypothetical protein
MTESEIIEALRSGEIQRQMAAMDEAARTIRSLMAESVRAFSEAKDPYTFAERLYKFGPSIIPTLEVLLHGYAEQGVKDLSAAVIVKLGGRTGVSRLLEVIAERRPYFPMTALILAEAQVHEAAFSIQQILEDWDCAADPYSAATMVDALKKLNALGDPLRQSLQHRWPPAMRSGLEKVLGS